MPQVMLEIEDTMVGRLNEAARSRNCTVSKYVAKVVSEKLSESSEEGKLPITSFRGSWKGRIWMADDFDAPLEEMAEYM